MPTIESPPGADSPAPGDRIRVTAIGEAQDEPGIYVGATGLITEVGRRYVGVDWDDVEVGDAALLRGDDAWEVVTDG